MAEIIIQGLFTNNLLLSLFLGICTFLAVSTSLASAAGLGVTMIIVMTLTVPATHWLYNHLLVPGQYSLLGDNAPDLTFLALLLAIAVIAGFIQILELVLFRFFPALYQSLGIFLPLLTVNCAILGASLFMLEEDLTFSQSIVYGAAGGTGWCMAIILFAAMRERLAYSRVPDSLRGLGMAFILAGLLSMGFSAVTIG